MPQILKNLDNAVFFNVATGLDDVDVDNVNFDNDVLDNDEIDNNDLYNDEFLMLIALGNKYKGCKESKKIQVKN